MISELSISQRHWQFIQHHAENAVPMEACGLIAGKGGLVQAVLSVTNITQDPKTFLMEPRQQLKAFEWIESRGMELVGIYHSHPAGPETLSPTDVGEAAYPVVQVILSREGDQWQTRGFWIETGQVFEVRIKVAH